MRDEKYCELDVDETVSPVRDEAPTGVKNLEHSVESAMIMSATCENLRQLFIRLTKVVHYCPLINICNYLLFSPCQ